MLVLLPNRPKPIIQFVITKNTEKQQNLTTENQRMFGVPNYYSSDQLIN